MPQATTPQLIRSSILVPSDVHQALQNLADKAERPLSWEIRRALEQYVAQAGGGE